MQAIVELSEVVLRELEALARSEGTTTADLIERIVQTHVASHRTIGQQNSAVLLPLIPASETGTIQAVSGRDLDELLSRDCLSA